MSSLVYPSSLPGLMWDSVRTPIFKTKIDEAVSGKESRFARQLFPRYRFELQYEFLRDNIATSDLKALLGLYEQMLGQWDTFLYLDPTFSAVTLMPFGTGDGTTAAFQLTATFQNSGGPGLAQLVQNLNGAPAIYKAGVLQTVSTHYTVGATGIITFLTPPTGGQALTWTGAFYYRCRFDMDEMPMSQFMRYFWAARKVTLKSVKL